MVNFMTSASDLVDGDVPVNCHPPSGSIFAIGTKTVTCAAVDRDHNINSGSFSVTVLPKPASGGAGAPAPLSTSFIPVTGEKVVDLVCGTLSTLQTPNGMKAEFLSVLCGYRVSFNDDLANTLPGNLTGTFTHGVTLQIFVHGTPLKLVPENASVRISFPMPKDSKASDYTVLYWNMDLNNGAGGWMELPLAAGKLNPDNPQDARQVLSGLQFGNGFAQITINFPGTFVIVKK